MAFFSQGNTRSSRGLAAGASPAAAAVDELDALKNCGAEVGYFDPYIPKIPVTREHGNWTGLESIEWEEGVISDYDCVIIATAHERIDFSDLAKWSDCIVDTRNAMQSINTSESQVTKA